MKTADQIVNNNTHKHKVRRTFVHSHSIYFLLFLAGVSLDLIFKLPIFSGSKMVPVGFGFLFLGTCLIVWAEKTSHNFKDGNISKENFCNGPYCYTRNPTHLGLFLSIVGFGFISNSLFIVLSALISFFIEKFIFQDKAEKILEEKYGAPYLEYKKSIKF